MKNYCLKMTIILLTLYLNIPVFSDDGMWMPHQMKDLNLTERGLQMNPDDLYKEDGTGLMSAVVLLGGGTGAFVSNEGLILTNHHVAYRGIQRASTPEHDYITNGFLAKTNNEEIIAHGYIADVLLGYKEITDQIWKHIKPGMTYLQKYDAIDKAEKRIIADAEKTGPGIRCEIAAMYGGNKFYLFTYKRLKDIRIVYAPPKDIGNFGGDIDNWMWPRHTGDFTFLRAYVSKENIGVEYDKKNVPYQPQSVLKISPDGLKEGDFTFVMGYPGKTYRNFTLSMLAADIDYLKERKERFNDLINFFDEACQGDKASEIKYAGKVRSLNNAVKNYTAKLENFEKVNIIQKKKEFEHEFLNWVNKDKKTRQRYEQTLNNIEQFMKKYNLFQKKKDRLTNLFNKYSGITLLHQAHQLFRMAEEREKPDFDREPEFMERNIPSLKQKIQLAEKEYDFEIDKAFFNYRLSSISKLSIEEIPKAFHFVKQDNAAERIKDYVDDLYTKTTLNDTEKRLQYSNYSLEKLLALNDPLIELAAKLENELKNLREEEKAIHQELLELKKVYLEGLLAMKDNKIAADANRTIRFTYGTIAGYSPRDAVYYQPFTSLTGVMEKETGLFPFHVQEKLKQLSNNKDFGRYFDSQLNSVPTCFLNSTNVTGGNSGSPTINAKGEQVGIIFDMTYESVIGDYYIIPEMQRTISVDIRYVLFITEKFAGAKYLIQEMGLDE